MGGGLVSKEKFFKNGKPTREVRCASDRAHLIGGPFCAMNISII